MKAKNEFSQNHALVIGASMAGLLTARILSDHFQQVSIVEKDVVHQMPEARKGQAHTRHLHGLLAQGFDIMQYYFPDLKKELKDGGAMVRDMGESMRWYINGGYRKRVSMHQDGSTMSRPFLEFLIRKNVLKRSNVRLRDQSSVRGLLFSLDRKKVCGLELTYPSNPEKPEKLMADLVVDASGRGSEMHNWLEADGYKPPKETKVKIKLGYATCIFERNPNLPGSTDWVFITPGSRNQTRMAGAFPIENNRWIVTLGGMSGDHPTDVREEFITYAQNLPAPDIYEIIRNNKALTDITLYKYPVSQRRHYEKLRHFPERLLVIGDAICSFNPIYGQGMTVAAMEAIQLDRLLRGRAGNLDKLARVFFKKAGKIIDIPWQIAVGEDFRYPHTEGFKPPGTDLVNAYIERVHNASHNDEVVCKAFLKVMNLIKPPASLFHPEILRRTLFPAKKKPYSPVLEKA